MKPLQHKYHFYKQPFVLIAICVATGILLGFEFREWSDAVLVTSLTLLISAFITYALNSLGGKLFYFFMASGFIMIGILIIQNRDGAWDENKLISIKGADDPVIIKLRDVGTGDRTWKKMTGDVIGVVKNGEQISVDEPIVLFVKADNFGCETSDVILVSSEIIPIKNAGNPGEFNAEYYWNHKGFRNMVFVGGEEYSVLEHSKPIWIVDQLNGIRNYLSNSLKENLSGKELAIAMALILGDKSLLDTEIKNSFTNTGAMHVLAVSGLHVGIIMQILMVCFAFFSKWISRKSSIITVVVIMWVYALLTGLSPSVLRAVFMFTVLVLAQLSGKNHNSINALFFTAFTLFLFDPYTLFDIGFQLSFLAMLGIFLFYRPIEQLIFIENKILRKVWQGTAIGFAAQLMTTPLSLYYFHQFPNYFVLTNIGLMASSGLILGLGIFIFSVSWLKPLAKVAGLLLGYIIFVSLWFIEWVESLPGAVAYGFELSFMLVFVMGILALYMFMGKRSTIYYRYSFALVTVLLCAVIWRRYVNLSNDQLCIFNSKQLIVTLKKGERIFCFYKADEEDFNKVKFNVESYLKVYPGKVVYLPINSRNYSVNSKDCHVEIVKKDGGFSLHVNARKYFIAFYEKEQILDSEISVGMPWIETGVDHPLSTGAYIAAL